jgi:hypothetical protein
MTRQIPHELFVELSSKDYAALMLEVRRVEYQLASWLQQGQSTDDHLSRHRSVQVIRDILSQCPDEYPPASTTELAFIPDADLRDSIRNDIGAADRALSNGEWKAATVLSGSAIEALLHWVLGERETEASRKSAGEALVTQGKLRTLPNHDLDRWELHELIEVSGHLNKIKPQTVMAANIARDYRNLIHPGRAKRLSQVCDRATAFSAIAGLEHVIRDLT